LYWKVCLTNGAVFLFGTLLLALSPVRVSEQLVAEEAVILVLGLGAMFGLNAAFLRLSLSPVDRVIRRMDAVHLAETGHRLEETGGWAQALATSYNAMLDRLQSERAAFSARALAAQEAERLRVAQELHDEIGQALTAVLLGLKRLRAKAPGCTAEIDLVREAAREGLADVRRVVRRLRPGTLEQLGLVQALAALCRDTAQVAGFKVERDVDRALPPLGPAVELVVFRVVQEALTNAARHADASLVRVRLAADDGSVVLTVEDDGRGAATIEPGAGVYGMRDRAAYVGGELRIDSAPGRGTRVRLTVPFDQGAAP
jgi:two-component system sensor histidine kinase UhpB